jgi:HSP20 family molecular chaperone IbpA
MTNTTNILSMLARGVQQMGEDEESDSIWGSSHRWPRIDVVNTESNLRIYADIPGVIPSDIKVEFFNNIVLIKGKRALISGELHTHELRRGDFSRRIITPISITRRDSVTITLSRGELCIDVDKTIEEQNRFTLSIHSSEDD